MKISVYRGKQLRTSFPSICIFQRLHGRKAPLWDPHFSLPTVIRIRSYSLANHSKNSLHEFPSSSNPWNVIIHVQPIPEIVEALSERWKKEERRENDSFSIRLMDIYYKRRTECKDAKGLKRNVYICPSSNSLFSGPLGLPSPQLWLILRLAFLSHRTGGRTSMGRAWRTKRNFVSRLTDKRNEGNIMYRFKQKIIIITIKSDI